MPAPRRTTALLLAALLLLLAVRLLHTASEKTFTIDEPHYVAKGLYLWRTGDYHWFDTLRLHPPLAYHIASLPLLALDLEGLGHESHSGLRLVTRAARPPLRIRIASRLPFVLLTCWGAFLAFAWAREASGDRAGLLAAFLFSFSPTLLAHGSLAHSDITFTILCFQTLYALWRWWRAPSALRLGLVGLSFGLALGAKASALLVPFMLAGVLGVLALRRELPWPRAVSALAAIGAIGVAVLWLSYGGSLPGHVGAFGPFEAIWLPDYLHSVRTDLEINDQDHYFWLFGRGTDVAPRWTLFAGALLKAPLPFLALAVGAALPFASPVFRRARLGLFLGLPAAFYAAVAFAITKLPYGIRYLLPVYPFVCLLVATRLAEVPGPRARGALAAACAALALASLAAHPHYLAYFNLLIGGPRHAHHYFADSNLDWGQDLGTLARWLQERGNPPVHLAVHAIERPMAYGMQGEILSGCEPVEEGLVAISAAVLRHVRSAANPLGRPPPGCYDWLLEHEPIAQPGHSILVYEIGGS